MRLICMILGLFSVAAHCGWSLQNQHSTLHFVSTKNAVISETHQFTKLSGNISDEGKVEVTIALDSVNTGIEIRDQRMKSLLFSVDTMPTASLKAAIDPTLLTLPVGQSKMQDVTGMLYLNDKEQNIAMKLRITRIDANHVLATTVAPVMLNASQFALADGVSKLQQIAGLADISLMVPVTFSVQFKAQ